MNHKFILYCSCLICKQKTTVQSLNSHINSHYKNIKNCPKCNNEHNNKGSYCSRSCANSRSHTQNTKEKISKSLKKDPIIVGPYTPIKKCKCKHCGKNSLYKSYKAYCNDCEYLYSHSGRAKYWFTFNVFKYPDLFDLEWLLKVGFRDNKSNPNGITRDHKISINSAIKNDYDPYYIKHPLNCELMLFNDNNKKKTNCSITYGELVRLIDQYDLK